VSEGTGVGGSGGGPSGGEQPDLDEELPTVPPPGSPGGGRLALRWSTTAFAARPGPPRTGYPGDVAVTDVLPVTAAPATDPTAALPAGGVHPGGPPLTPATGAERDEGRRRSRGTRVTLATGLVILVAAGVVLAVAAPWSATPQRAFGRLLATVASARALTGQAAGRACLVSAPASPARAALVAELSRAVALDEPVVAVLSAPGSRSRFGFPGAGPLVADLRTVASTAVSVARLDRSWLEDLQATGCYSAPTNDLHYMEAQRASAGAQAAAADLARRWSAVAAGRGLRLWPASSL
jgi:hypothetical protein